MLYTDVDLLIKFCYSKRSATSLKPMYDMLFKIIRLKFVRHVV